MNKEIDLVLSGSGVRLGIHYGAILALKKRRFKIVRIAGVSGGAIIAAAYACFYPFEDIWHILKTMNFSKLMCDGKSTSLFRLPFRYGLYKGKEFEKFIENKITKGSKLKDFPDLTIIASNLNTKSPFILNSETYGEMKISEAIRMSMSAPIYWVPKKKIINKNVHYIVDGGIANNYPIDFFDDNLRESIGINLYNKKNKHSKFKIIDYFRNILSTLVESNENEHIEDAYWAKTIKINTGDIRAFDLNITSEQIEWCIKRGYQKTLEVLNNKIERRFNNA